MRLLCDGKSIFKGRMKLSSSLIPDNDTVVGLILILPIFIASLFYCPF
jgi:hypothetical protein